MGTAIKVCLPQIILFIAMASKMAIDTKKQSTTISAKNGATYLKVTKILRLPILSCSLSAS
jgi:hypothetical protein